jgi:hypothetical protein
MAKPASEVWRRYVSDGAPASGVHSPNKDDIREWAVEKDQQVYALQVEQSELASQIAGIDLGGSAGTVVFQTKSALDGALDYDANTMAWVVADSTAANNGIYEKVGATGTGSWTKRAELPLSAINGQMQNYLRVYAAVQPKIGLGYTYGEVERVRWNLYANGRSVYEVGGDGSGQPSNFAIDVASNGSVTFPNSPTSAPVLRAQDYRTSRRAQTPQGSYAGEIAPLAAPTNYNISIGDNYRPLRVASSYPTFRCAHLRAGLPVEIITDGSAVRLDAGVGSTWRGVGARFIDVPDDRLVQVRRINATECVCAVLAGGGTLLPSSSQSPVAADHTIVMIGQSLGYRCFEGFGLEGFQRAMVARSEEWAFVNAAQPSTALLEGNAAGADDWWINDDGTAGPQALAAFDKIDAAISDGDPSPSLIYWDQGQNDIAGVNTGVTTFATYRDQLIALAGLFRDRYSGVKFAITPMPSREGANAGRNWQQVVREAQLAAIGAESWIVHGAETYDLERRYQDEHITLEGQRMQGYRLALIAQTELLSLTPALGPKINSVTRVNSTQIDVAIDVTGGFEFPAWNEGWTDFAVLPAGAPTGSMTAIPIIRAVHQSVVGSVRTYRMTQASADNTGRLVYPFGYAEGGALGRHIRSNTDLPCRSFRQA